MSRSGRDSAKLKKRRGGSHDPAARRIARLRETFACFDEAFDLGLKARFDALTLRERRFIAQFKIPDPEVAFAIDPRLHEPKKVDANERRFRDHIRQLFRETAVEVVEDHPKKGSIAVRDIYGCFLGMCSAGRLAEDHSRKMELKAKHAEQPDSEATAGEQSWERINTFLADAGAAFRHVNGEGNNSLFMRSAARLHHNLGAELARRSSMAGNVLVSEIGQRNARFGLQLIVTITLLPTQSRTIRLDGIPRRTFDVARDNHKGGLNKIAWKPIDVGVAMPDPERERPVVVQGHALDQLQQRLKLPGAEDFLEVWLHESLVEPKIVDRRGKDRKELLIAYRIHDDRLGYLMVTPTDQAFVVRTFLFLTMAPSPEFRQLEKRLGLTRTDADYLRLTEVGPYLHTDLRQDERLRSTFEAAGCGHLFRLPTDSRDLDPKPFAADVNEYLRLAA